MIYIFRKKFIIKVIFIVLFFVLLNLYQKEVRNFFYSISSFFQKSFWFIGKEINNGIQSIVFLHKNQRENQELKILIQELLSKTAIISNLEDENKMLREALGVGLQKDFKLVFAQVVGKDISQDYLIINKGAKDKIVSNLPIITEQKILVGRITDVYDSFSRVELITNKKSSLEAKIQGKEIKGLVKGKNNLRMTLDLVPQYEEVKEGDFLQTTSTGNIFPKGILVGLIKEVQKSDVEPFQKIEVQPFFNLKQLDNIFIITEF